MSAPSTSDAKDFVVKNRASIWLSFAVMIVAATMMHPTFASLLAMAIIAGLLFALRWAAHVEGRSQ